MDQRVAVVFEQSLTDWTKAEVRDRLTSRLGVEETAERLSSRLQKADTGLEVSESSIRLVKQAVDLTSSTGASMETNVIERLLAELGTLRDQLAEATQLVERIRERTANNAEVISLAAQEKQSMPLVLRLVGTLGSIESRLGALQNMLAEAQQTLEVMKVKILRWILIATVGIEMLLPWMAAGQIALCLHSRRALCRPTENAV